MHRRTMVRAEVHSKLASLWPLYSNLVILKLAALVFGAKWSIHGCSTEAPKSSYALQID